MTKEDLIKYIDPERQHIDVAVPVSWAMSAREIQIDPSIYAWSYKDDKIQGKPVNLMEAENEMLRETIKDLLDANQEFTKKIEVLESKIRKQKVFG